MQQRIPFLCVRPRGLQPWSLAEAVQPTEIDILAKIKSFRSFLGLGTIQAEEVKILRIYTALLL